jgi:hypothetical protein
MLADREAIEERDLEVRREEEHQAVIMPTSKPYDGVEAIILGAIGFLVLMMGASLKK